MARLQDPNQIPTDFPSRPHKFVLFFILKEQVLNSTIVEDQGLVLNNCSLKKVQFRSQENHLVIAFCRKFFGLCAKLTSVRGNPALRGWEHFFLD